MDLTIFDVEHGACALLTCDNGIRMMIDCGHNSSTGWRPGTYLRQQGVTSLDMLAVTNYDEDHMSGLPNLSENVSIQRLLRNKSVSPNTLKYLKSEDGMGVGIAELANMATTYTLPADPLHMPGVQYQTFHLNYPEFDDENNLSLVIALSLHGIGFLFPGDLETRGWNTLLARDEAFRNAVAKTHVLVASHHGRENGICPDLFSKYGCSPFWIVISDKGYMHDTQETIPFYSQHTQGATFRGNKRKVLTTRKDGVIRFWLSDGKWDAT
ncbi:MAG: hypothetical protein V5B36_03225 [Candidatus Accumulibacter sp. UW25]|jgi:beta-lactamase superfamily II metal-dependent hydrolase